MTVKDAYPIPRTDDRLSKLGAAKFFTTLDLGSAFWQVPLRKKDREKTGFACELGLYQWKRMPLGLCNATATFQRLMTQALTRLTRKSGILVMCYVDDVVIATPTLEDHIDRLDEVFGCMKKAGLKCKPSKCEILRDSIKYLGRMVDRHGVRPDPEAVEAVLTWKAPRKDTQLLSFLWFANYYREFIKGYADKMYPMQKLMRNKGKKFEWNNEELCEAPVLGMPTKKGMYVLDTDASVVAISGILHQEQEWNGRTVLRPIAYGSKVLSDTEMKYGAPKAEMFAVVTLVEKYRAYLGSAPFKLRVDNRALSWLKTYAMDQSYIGRWIVRLDGYHMIIEHMMRDKHQNADSLSKKTEFYERLEQKQANQAEIKEGFSFLDKETYEALPLTRWLDKSGHPIPGHPELPVEKAAEIMILSREDPVPLDLLLRSNLVQQELSRMNINSLSLLDRTVQVTPQMMRMLGGLLEREVTRDDPEWTAAVASLTISEKVKIIPSGRQHEENERDCRTIVQQLVSSINHEILTSTSCGQKEQGSSKRKKTVTFVDQDKEGEKVEQNLLQDYLSGETNDEKNQRSQDQHPGIERLSGESDIDEKIPDEKQDLENKVLSGEFRWMRRRHGHDLEERAVSSTTSSTDDKSQNSEMDTYSDRNSSSGSELSELAVHTLLVETRARDLDREVYQDPDSDRYLIPSERVFDNAADDLETKAVSKRSISLLPQKEVVRTDLQPFKQETQPLAKIWCVKMEEDTHQPNELNSQMRVMKTYLKARYRLSDLLRAHRNDRMTSNLKRWIENGSPDKGDLEEDSYRILRQYFMQKEGRLYLNKDGIVACKRREEDRVLYKYMTAHLLDTNGTKIGVTGLLDRGAVVSVMPIKTWERMGFTREDLIPTNLRLAAANRGAIYVAGRTPITVLQMGGRDLWMSFLVVENLDDADQFILGRDFVRNFDVMIDLNNGLIRIRNPDRKYVKRPNNRIITDENKVPIFLDRKVKLQPGQAVVAIFRMRNLNSLSDSKQVCLVPNPNSQSSVILGRSFSVTRNGLCVSVLLNTLDTTVSIKRGKKLGYALPMRTDYEETKNLKKHSVKDCPYHANKDKILKRINELKSIHKLFSMKSETDEGLSSCSNFPERPSSYELESDKPVLPEIEHFKRENR